MKNLAHRRAYISYDELKRVFGIPEDVDIVMVQDTNASVFNGDIELLLVSKEPVEGFTVNYQPEGGYTLRRLRLKAEEDK
ncbi:hypothetical protein [Bacillus phage vB_BanS-Thrax1]|nr:hypothetical protein [Bacillus phage vB_BanS-Thrax1]